MGCRDLADGVPLPGLVWWSEIEKNPAFVGEVDASGRAARCSVEQSIRPEGSRNEWFLPIVVLLVSSPLGVSVDVVPSCRNCFSIFPSLDMFQLRHVLII